MMRGAGKVLETIGMVLRIFSVWIVALFLPKIFLWSSNHTRSIASVNREEQLKLGIENISDKMIAMLSSRHVSLVKVGLITDQCNHAKHGESSVTLLEKKGLSVTKIFSCSTFFPPLIQGSKKSIIHLTEVRRLGIHDVDDVDLIMFDVQDASMLYKSYLALLFNAMDVAAKSNKRIVVLDRPNMLGGIMEGATAPIPLRHGMTVGELAHYYNKHVLSQPALLSVVPMENYSRSFEARDLGSSHYTAQTESWYSHALLGMLAQVKPFDLALETDQAFQCILLPETYKITRTTWDNLAQVLKKNGIESSYYRYYNKKSKQWYQGLHLFIADMQHFSSYKIALTIMKFFKDAGVPLSFSTAFDQEFGTDTVRSFLQGTISEKVVATEVNEKVQKFFNKAFDCFLYKPLPKMVML